MNKKVKAMGISFVINTVLSLGKILTGIFGKSSALITDGIHSFSDLVTDIISIIGIGFSHRNPNKKKIDSSKSELITNFIVGSLIILLGIGIIYDMSHRAEQIPEPWVAIAIALFIAIKYALSNYMFRESEELESHRLVSNAKENKSDVFSSVLVFASVLIAQLVDVFPALIFTDKITSVVISIYIIRIGVNVLRESYTHLKGEALIDELYLKNVNELILKNEEVTKIIDLSVVKFKKRYNLVSTIKMNKKITLGEAHKVSKKIEKSIKRFDKRIEYITIHMEADMKSKKK